MRRKRLPEGRRLMRKNMLYAALELPDPHGRKSAGHPLLVIG
jgi:hypothetical protein